MTEMEKRVEAFNESIERRRKSLRIAEALVAAIATVEWPPEIDLVLSTWGIELKVKDLKGLRAVRKTLRTLWPSYTDRLNYIGTLYGDIGYASYIVNVGTSEIDLQQMLKIVLEHPVTTWPLKLKDGCGFRKVKTEISSESWSYSCDGPGIGK